MRLTLSVAVFGLMVLAYAEPLAAESPAQGAGAPPVIPIGHDAFLQWDRWPYLRIGQRTYMTSTFDRRGGNESADASHFLYQLADDRNVTMDVTGPGVLVFARYNHWHGSPWHYVVDGQDHVVQESSSANPEKPVPDSVFLPEDAFPNPLTWTWSRTKGADLMWVPIPFEKSFLMAYERTRYGTGYYIWQRFAPGTTHLSQPIRSWTPRDIPPKDVLDLLASAGSDIAPKGTAIGARFALDGERRGKFLTLPSAPAMVRAIQISAPRDKALELGKVRIQATWDDRREPSIDAPVPLFFGAGTLYNRDDKEYLVQALPVSIRFDAERVHLACYFPMPFFRTARIGLSTPEPVSIPDMEMSIRWTSYEDPPNHVAYFHATYKDHGEPEPGRDLVFLDTREVEGGGEWCGHFVGTSFIFTDRNVLTTLEGDPRFYFDDALSPQAQGTGTEEWGGGGDYWGGRTMTLPFAGHPVGAVSAKEAKCAEDQIHSAYRFLLGDLMPFGRNARITFEHGGENNSTEHYRSVTYWYGRNQACLRLSDTLHVSDAEDERKHGYTSPGASDVQTLSSRYPWGPDHFKGREMYPETIDTGRFTRGTSTFRMEVDSSNCGVLLRRKFDYGFPNQCAKVAISDDRDGAPWHDMGLWYAAGSSTVVYSDPQGELGATLHNVQESNRRWREDEFLLPAELTAGRSAIRVRLEFVPREIPLFPGHPLAEQAWSEYRYWAYSYVMPRP